MTTENNTTTATETPQVEETVKKILELTDAEKLERARAADTRTVINLDSSKLYQEFEQFGTEPGTYKDTSPIQGNFWRYRFRGVVVIVSPDFKKEFDQGSIQSIVATPTVNDRYISDPNNAGMLKQQIVPGYSITYSGIGSMQKELNAKKLAAKLKIDLLVQEKTEDQIIEATLAAITPEMIKATIKQADIDEMLAKI